MTTKGSFGRAILVAVCATTLEVGCAGGSPAASRAGSGGALATGGSATDVGSGGTSEGGVATGGAGGTTALDALSAAVRARDRRGRRRRAKLHHEQLLYLVELREGNLSLELPRFASSSGLREATASSAVPVPRRRHHLLLAP